MSTTNRTTTQARDGQIIAGINKHLQNVPTPITFAGQQFTPQTLILFFQQRIDLANQVAAARAQWVSLSQQYQDTNLTTEPVARGLRQYVMNLFGATSPTLADFGFAPPKRTPLTVEQQKVAIAKRAATRKARNTLGKKEKKSIHGTVPVTDPPTTPIPAPVAPATSAPVSPAPATPAPQAVPHS